MNNRIYCLDGTYDIKVVRFSFDDIGKTVLDYISDLIKLLELIWIFQF